MSNIRTLTSSNNKSSQNDWKKTTGHKLQEDMQTDEPDCGNSTGTGNRPNNSAINMNTMQPKKLSNNDVCLLYKEFLQGLEEEDREMCIATLKKEKITGRTLVLACENDKIMEEVIETLHFPLDFKLRFDDMIKQIKKRQKELKEDNENNENEQANQISPTAGTDAPQEPGQTISNAGCVIGAMHNHGQRQNISTGCTYYGKEKKNSP